MTNRTEPWGTSANSVQGSVAVGGRIALGTEALVFVPNGFETAIDSSFGSLASLFGREAPAQSLELQLQQIATVGKLERDFSIAGLMGGGLRERLSITMRDGTEHVFVVNGIDDVIARIAACVP